MQLRSRVLLGWIGIFFFVANGYAITLREACEQAITHTELQTVFEKQASQAKKNIDIAKAGLWPKVNLTFRSFNVGMGPAAPLTMVSDYLVFPFDLTSLDIRSQEFALEELSWSQFFSKMELSQTIVQLYFDVDISKTICQHLQFLISLHQKRLKEVQSWVSIGRSKTTDAVAIQIEMGQVQANLHNQHRILASQLKELGFWIGKTDLREEDIQKWDVPSRMVVIKDVQKWVQDRPDIHALLSRLNMVSTQEKSAQLLRWPALNLGLIDFKLAAVVTYPLYDFGVLDARQRQRQDQLVELTRTIDRQKRRITTELEVAYQNWKLYQSQEELLKKNERLAYTFLTLVRQDYAHHLLPNLDVIYATNQWYQANLALELGRLETMRASALFFVKKEGVLP